MSNDEAKTISTITQYRTSFRSHIESNGGRVVDMAGDSVLAVFGSAVSAVRAAVATQDELAERNELLPDERRMRFRVGVNLGEIHEAEDGAVYGDGVNIAARLEGLAAPGGVCISAVVLDQLHGKLEESFEDIGEHSVKNVAKPIHGFAWGGISTDFLPPAPHSSRKPTVAIAEPSVTGDADAASMAFGMRDDIAISLASQTALDLVPDVDRADFVVSVALQLRGSRYRANAHVLDRATGRHFAASRFDGESSDLFRAQDELAYRIYNTVRLGLHDHAYEHARNHTDTEGDGQTLLNRAADLINTAESSAYAEARRLLDIAVAREPRSFMAWALKAISHLFELVCGYRAVASNDRAVGLEAARQAVQLNQQSDFAHIALSQVHLWAEGDLEAARREARRSLELNPNYALANDILGFVSICSGQAEDGLVPCLLAAEADPRSRSNHWTMQRIALGQFALGRYQEAIDWALRSDQRQPDSPRTLLILASAGAHAGNDKTSSQAVERLLAHFPQFRIRDFGNWPFRDSETAERLVEGLRLAGLPE